MDSIVQLKNLDDLKKVLFLQKTITTRAKNELLAAVSDSHLNQGDPLDDVEKFQAEERKILDKYAKYPTLTEFQLMPNAYDGYKWGATFGVALLVGELIFEPLKNFHPDLGPVIRQLFVTFLSELDEPKHEYLVQSLEKVLRFKVTTAGGEEISEEKKMEHIRRVVNSLAESMVTVSEGYGLVQAKKGGVAITQLGRRVLLHLVDASKFVQDMTKAHAKFQKTKPKFSMN